MDTILTKYQTFMAEYLPKRKNNDKTFFRHVTRTAKKPKKNYQKHNEKCEYYTPEYEKEDNVDRLDYAQIMNILKRPQVERELIVVDFVEFYTRTSLESSLI